MEIAAIAGIDASHPLSRFVAVPKWLVRPQERIRDERRMWEHRHAAGSNRHD
jgi:hypothetical protein